MIQVCFRNDDLGWNQPALFKLLELFKKRSHKINVPAIPLACKELNLQEIDFCEYSDLLQITAHGHSHEAFVKTPKNSEYPDERETDQVLQLLIEDHLDLQKRFSKLYYPVFTPPWNRMAAKHVANLKKAGYRALSRYENTEPQEYIPELNMSLDLHTDKKNNWDDPELIIHKMSDLSRQKKFVGVMLHHNKMTEQDFTVLDVVLEKLQTNQMRTVYFSDLLGDQNE